MPSLFRAGISLQHLDTSGVAANKGPAAGIMDLGPGPGFFRGPFDRGAAQAIAESAFAAVGPERWEPSSTTNVSAIGTSNLNQAYDTSNTSAATIAYDAPSQGMSGSAYATFIGFGTGWVSGARLYVRVDATLTESPWPHYGYWIAEYSIDGGTNWTLLNEDSTTGTTRLTLRITLSGTIDLSQIRVRFRADGTWDGIASDGTSTTLTIYDINVSGNVAQAPQANNIAGTGSASASGTANLSTGIQLAAKTGQNLLQNSDSIGSGTGWNKYGVGTGSVPVVTPFYTGAAAPDGTLTAHRIQLNLNGGNTDGDESLINQGWTPAINRGVRRWRQKIWMRSTDGVSTYTVGQDTVGAYQNCTVTGTWQSFEYEYSLSASAGVNWNTPTIRGGRGQSNSADILVWHPQFEIVGNAQSGNYVPGPNAVEGTGETGGYAVLSGVIALSASASASPSALANMNSAIQMVTASAGNASATTASLSTQIRLAATASATTAYTPPTLIAGAAAFASSVSASPSATASLSTAIRMNATASATTAVAAANMNTAVQMVSGSAAVATVTAASLTTAVKLAATATAVGTAGPTTLSTQIYLLGVASASPTPTATMTTQIKLRGATGQNLLRNTDTPGVGTGWNNSFFGTALPNVVTPNYTGAQDPDGGYTASRWQMDQGAGTSSGDFAYIGQNISVSAAGGKRAYTVDVWMRSTDGVSTYNVTTEIEGSPSIKTITGTWQKFTKTGGAANFTTSINVRVAGVRTSDGASATADILVWHPQVNQSTSSAPTYVPGPDVAGGTGEPLAIANMSTAIQLACNATATATATAPVLVTAIQLSSTASASPSVLAANLLIPKPLAATASSTATPGAPVLTTAIQAAASTSATPAQVATLSTAIQLIGTASATGAGSASLATGIQMAATASAAPTTILANLSGTATGFSSNASASASGTATLTTAIQAAGSASATPAYSAVITTAIRLAATASATPAASTPGLTTAIKLAASQTANSSAVANLSTAVQMVAGSAAVATSTAASLTTQVRLAATTSAAATGTGSFSTAANFQTNSSAVPAATAGLTTAIQLAGSAAAMSSVTSAQLTVGTRFATTSSASPTATATLTTAIKMAGTGAGLATAGLPNLVTFRLLAATAAATSSGTGAISTQIRLAAQGAAQATSTANLTTQTRLASNAAGGAQAAADLTTGIQLQGTAGAQAQNMSAQLTTQVALAGSAAAGPVGMGDIITYRLLMAFGSASPSYVPPELLVNLHLRPEDVLLIHGHPSLVTPSGHLDHATIAPAPRATVRPGGHTDLSTVKPRRTS